MIGMKDQCFGVEVEMTGLTRGQAAQALANYFGTEPYYVGGGYDKWSVKDPDGKVWSIMSDSSIVTEMKTESGYMHTSNIEYRVEMVTPKLTYAELEYNSPICAARCRSITFTLVHPPNALRPISSIPFP